MPLPHPFYLMNSKVIIPSPIYIFDLDDVLMPTGAMFSQPHVQGLLRSIPKQDTINTYSTYQQIIHKDLKLNKLLAELKSDRYLLTNGSQLHALASLHALGISDYFINMVHSNSGVGLKPNQGPYALMEHVIRNRYAPHVPLHQPAQLPPFVFFDDRVENHEHPKQRGWTTVWIYPYATNNILKPHYVDYVFPDIYVALEYFLMIQNQYTSGSEYK